MNTSPESETKEETPNNDFSQLANLVLTRERRTLLAADLADSVGLIAQNESEGVAEIQGFLAELKALSEASGGRLVSWLGDGLIVEFLNAVDAVRVALQLHATQRASRRSQVRVALHAADVLLGPESSYGHGVAFARTLTQLANPGDVLATEAVYESVIDGIDGAWRDIGERLIGDPPVPIRLWRLAPTTESDPASAISTKQDGFSNPSLTVAILPISTPLATDLPPGVAQLLAESIVARLSRHKAIRVISADSTERLRGRSRESTNALGVLAADVLVKGQLMVNSHQWRLRALFNDQRAGTVTDAIEETSRGADPMLNIEHLANAMAAGILQKLNQHALARAQSLPLPTLDSATLLLAAVQLIHHHGARQLETALKILQVLTERHRRAPVTWAWLAKYHVQRFIQGAGDDPTQHLRLAIEMSQRALDIDPQCALAMALQGHAQSHWGKDPDIAQTLLREALSLEPNHPMALLYEGQRRYFWEDAATAVAPCEEAIRLSPLDPQAYYFEMHLGTAYMGMGEYEKACTWLGDSWRRNAMHLSTLRAYISSLYMAGKTQDARHYFRLLRERQPNLTLERFRAAGRDSRVRRIGATAFEALGMPAK